jgi:transposase
MFDHYIGLDWAQNNMAIAKMTPNSTRATVVNVASSLKDLQIYLSHLKGRKILTFEETTTSQWLYVELKDCVDEILVCDPYRNHLLSEGAKTDELDAIKLVQLLKANLLKPVFHSAEGYIDLRKLVSGYEDVVKAGVRLKNQRSSLFRAQGKAKTEKNLPHRMESFVLEGLDHSIEAYESEKSRYEQEMAKQRRKYVMIRNLDGIFGIGVIAAVKIAARVVDAQRFENKGKWLSYCGLVRHEKLSGGKSYGWKGPRYCRTLKSVFKTAALSVLHGKSRNCFKDYYEFILKDKQMADYDARHAVARKIAVIAWAVMKSGKVFDPEKMSKAFQK